MPARHDYGAGDYPQYRGDEEERLCPYCMEGMVQVDLEEGEGDCDKCGRRVTFDGPGGGNPIEPVR